MAYVADFVENTLLFDINKYADPHFKNWLPLTSWLFPSAVLAIYLSSVLYIVPWFMKNRKPYSLKNVLYYYNISQILVCSAVSFTLIREFLRVMNSPFGCQPKTSSTVAYVMYFNVFWRIYDLIETNLYALRKKYNQISLLHVYHHCGNFFISWIAALFSPGGTNAYNHMINYFIHSIMFTYYYLSSEGSENVKRMIRVYKSYLTVLQIVQLVLLTYNSTAAVVVSGGGCAYHFGVESFSAIHTAICLILFLDFYYSSYINKKKSM